MVTTNRTFLQGDMMRLDHTVHIIVATPGRVLDFVNQGVADLSGCLMIVMDEADKHLSTSCRARDTFIGKGKVNFKVSSYLFGDCQVVQWQIFEKSSRNEFNEWTKCHTRWCLCWRRTKGTLLSTLFSKEPMHHFCNSTHRVGLFAKKMRELGYSCFYIHHHAMVDKMSHF